MWPMHTVAVYPHGTCTFGRSTPEKGFTVLVSSTKLCAFGLWNVLDIAHFVAPDHAAAADAVEVYS